MKLLELTEWGLIGQVAEGVQKAVDGGKWAYLAVIGLFVVIQVLKRSQHIKRNATQYAAGAGAAAGAVLSNDPVSGAVGGLMVGNAASGLYSLLKPIIQGELLAAILAAFKMASFLYKRVDKKTRKEKIKEFDKAVEKTKGENPSTKDLEEWFKKNI